MSEYSGSFPDESPTQKQIDFATRLAEERNTTVDEYAYDLFEVTDYSDLTRRQFSELIDGLMKQPRAS